MVYMPSHRFQGNLARMEGPPNNFVSQSGMIFGFFRGKLDYPPAFFTKNPMKITLKKGKEVGSLSL